MPSEFIDFNLEKKPASIIKVIGIGGGGSNAVNHMFRQGIHDVDFVVCNTDAQALDSSPVKAKVQLGESLTEGRGAGNKPEIGKEAARENIDQVRQILGTNTKMVFITAGMGGGTGTGGAPIVAQMCKQKGYLTVAIVTIPFRNEGRRRVRQAIEGISELEAYTDSLLIINNERIREMYGDFPISQAFAKADDVLTTAAKGIAEIITVPGYINVDFADVETVMRQSGVAVMGTGIAEGEGRALEAVEKALTSPLLNYSNIKGAKNVLLNINSGDIEVTMAEIGEITEYIQKRAGFEADIIWGNGVDKNLGPGISVTVIATGFSVSSIPEMLQNRKPEREIFDITGKVDKPAGNSFGNPTQSYGKVNQNTMGPSAPNSRSFESESRKPNIPHDEFEALYPKTAQERNMKTRTEPHQPDFTNMCDEEIEELEKVPAYLRKQLDIKNPAFRKKEVVSKISVSGGDKKNVFFRENNSYLHKNLD
jgi:cell division protein FtsZ